MKCYNHSQSLLRRGFSLVELLAVMGVIAVLLSLASVGVSQMGKAQGLTSGIAISEGLFNQARSEAIAKNTFTRVVIHNQLNDQDQEDRRRYRRMITVVAREVNPDTGRLSTEWRPISQPTILPDQVYYSPNLSALNVETGGRISSSIHPFGKQPQDEVDSYYYEFNPQGICTSPGATFVLSSGPRPPGAERPILGNRKTYGGFVVWRNGSTGTIRDINQIEESF